MKSRLDKLLADNGWGSRRDIKRLLRERSLTVNGAACRDPSIRVDPETDALALDDLPIMIREFVYLMLNKPAGVVTSTSDPDHATVIDLLGEPWASMGLFPIGRLDRDTEGLLVITNDGPLTHRLTAPKSGCPKAYLARLRDPVDEALFREYERSFREGVSFHDGYTCMPASLSRAMKACVATPGDAMTAAPGADALRDFRVVIHEGKYHQVKKMFKAVGNEVAFLKRLSMGGLDLDPALAPGAFRELTAEEIRLLREGPGGKACGHPRAGADLTAKGDD